MNLIFEKKTKNVEGEDDKIRNLLKIKIKMEKNLVERTISGRTFAKGPPV